MVFLLSEAARRNVELGTILAKGNPKSSRAVLLELWGSPQFGLRQKLVTDRDAEGTVLLLSSLDYEKKTVHHLTLLANVSDIISFRLGRHCTGLSNKRELIAETVFEKKIHNQVIEH